MRGSVRWRCSACRKEGIKTEGRCGHKEGAYHVAYRYGGRQLSKLVGPSKKDAERVLGDIVSRIKTGTYNEQDKILFKDFAERWLEEYARGAVKPSTFRNYQNMLRKRVNPIFGNQELDKITTYKLQSFSADMLKKRNANTVLKFIVLLKTVFKHARRWGFLKDNPALDVERPRVEHREMDFFTPTEIRLLLEHAEEPFKTIFLTAILTGLRRGELLALQWSDIDWQSNLIHVRRSIYMLNKDEAKDFKEKQCWKFITPKSKKSIRRIVMSPVLREALQVHQLNSDTNRYDLIFTNHDREPMDGQNLINREFYPTLEAAGLRKIRFHDLRHTYCSLLIAQNENIKFIQSQLGHASITTTIDRYGHVMPQEHEGVGAKLDEYVFGAESAREVAYAKRG